MNVGLHRDIPKVIYHALDLVSSHRLGLLKRSPAHLKWSLENPEPQTPAMKLGEAVHTAVLEYSKFENLYVKAPEVDRRTKAGKECWDLFVSEQGDKVVLDSDSYTQVLEMSAAIARHETAANLLNHCIDIELTAIWNDELTGLKCKGLIDSYAPSLDNVNDLKTTSDASPREFERSIFRYGYHRQAAFYLDGMKALGENVEHYTIIAVENKAPYAVAVYRLRDEVIDLGRRENEKLLNLYERCQRSGEWPAYPLEVLDIGIPAWAVKQTENDFYLNF